MAFVKVIATNIPRHQPSYSQMIRVSISIVFRFHYHSQKVTGSLRYIIHIPHGHQSHDRKDQNIKLAKQFQAVETYFILLFWQYNINSFRFYGKHTKLAGSSGPKKQKQT